ncbi:glycosyltransferase family 2 protein [Flavobacterium covae]|nr:glycosyltransferase family 2 protein [Flavobacterium covae]QYS91377.1 glycosyltransferase family 2 protein [Flavobacterium covae]
MERNSELIISVVIPMYNASKTIVRSLDSVKNQTYKCNYQIIVVNDGSKDNSKEIVEDYISKNSQMNVILINQSNGGVSKARNIGLKYSLGNFIAFLDSDDYWLQYKIEIQIKYINLGYDFVCGLRNNERISFPYKISNNFSEISLKKLLLKVVGQTSTAFFKKRY